MGIFGDRQHHFEADIAIFPLGPTTRNTHPFNGIRWDICYPDEVGAQGLAQHVWMVWPEFVDGAGNSIAAGVPLQGRLHALMHILSPDLIEEHRRRLTIGGRFFCTEGPRRMAEGIVTTLAPMA